MNCKTILITVLPLLVPVLAWAQGRVDYTALQVEMSRDPMSYDRLLTRFENLDADLTGPDLERVYYGYVCSPGYDPGSDWSAVVEALDAAEWDKAYGLAVEAMVSNPVSLELTALAARAAEQSGDPAVNAALSGLVRRVDMLAMAILSSGLGTVPEAPFYVTRYDDALAVVKLVFNASAILGRSSVGPVDAIKFTLDDPEREHILYFSTYGRQ